jgi:isopentenyl diphosphate isomerase/L-lactate dehydrogenase-like FMN-dependent dehydrogenase
VAAIDYKDADLDQRRYIRRHLLPVDFRALTWTVLTAEDTLLAVKYGVDGVIVSNHGGRQLDGVPATLDALPECVEAAAGRIPVHVDGGFRKGSDIFKALALGADCCWVGRVAIWGLAVSVVAHLSLA